MKIARIGKSDPRYYGRNLPDYNLDEPERRQVYYDGTIVGEEDDADN